MPRKKPTDAELEAEDKRLALQNALDKRLLTVETKLNAAGLDLDELIELIEARQNGSY